MQAVSPSSAALRASGAWEGVPEDSRPASDDRAPVAGQSTTVSQDFPGGFDDFILVPQGFVPVSGDIRCVPDEFLIVPDDFVGGPDDFLSVSDAG